MLGFLGPLTPFILIFAGLLIVGGLLYHRRHRLRLMRRSPLTRAMLRPPGHSILQQIGEVREEVEMALMLTTTMPMMLVALHFAQSAINDAAESVFRVALTAAAVLGFMGYYGRKLLLLSRRMDRLRVGHDAEMAVGQELDQLMLGGARVFHDFPAEKFNIDHIVIAPNGVFAVETKGRAKPIRGGGKEGVRVRFDGRALHFPGWSETGPVEQAERQAVWLQKWLTSATGEAVSVQPALAIPGWFIERAGQSRMPVFNGRSPQFLLGWGGSGETLSAARIQAIAHQVEQRCRSVAPSFNRDPAEVAKGRHA